jgi:hypothetical protein
MFWVLILVFSIHKKNPRSEGFWFMENFKLKIEFDIAVFIYFKNIIAFN